MGQFAKDNDCIFMFSVSGFCVKDQLTGRVLMAGPISDGLYPIKLGYGEIKICRW